MSSSLSRPLHVLFLCTHNSARSILSQALLNHLGQGRFIAHSAGGSPREHEQPHPLALEALTRSGIATDGLRSKSWEEYARPGAPHMDLIITVCDNAANEICPVWPGHPATAHWGYADPSLAEGDEAERLHAFLLTMHLIRQRLELLINLPTGHLVSDRLQGAARDLSQP